MLALMEQVQSISTLMWLSLYIVNKCLCTGSVASVTILAIVEGCTHCVAKAGVVGRTGYDSPVSLRSFILACACLCWFGSLLCMHADVT